MMIAPEHNHTDRSPLLHKRGECPRCDHMRNLKGGDAMKRPNECECCKRRWLDVTWRCVAGSWEAARMLCSTCAMQLAEALEVTP